jgi:CBS domain-containing membrane protein
MKVSDCMKRNVVAILATATLDEAVRLLVARHIGLLPIVDERRRPVGVLGLRDLLTLALPAFVDLMEDVDFVLDFGAAELTRPSPEVLAQSVTKLMRPPTTIQEDCGLLRAYALMRQHDLHDLPVVAADGTLVGILSRVDLATAVLAGWQAGAGTPPC